MQIIYNTFGIIGDFLILLAYFLLHLEKITYNNFSYPFMNFIGALLIVFSLLFAWNLPAFIIEISWIGISLYGLYRYFKNKTKKKF